ncbi:MAG: hypothetical protein WBW94_09940 [Anaerolineales bacterium]
MNEETTKWLYQYYSNIGVKEVLRFGCFLIPWILLGIAIESAFHSIWILFVFIALLFIFRALSLAWRPTYHIHRKILGNPNLPTEPIPHRPVTVSRPK